MSHFYGSVRGSAASAATRQGSPDSGLETHAHGWNLGVRVTAHADGDEDVFRVYITGGSHGGDSVYAFTVRDSEDGIVIDEIGEALVAVVLEEEED